MEDRMDVRLDLSTVTLGEALAVERASEQDFDLLMRRKTTRLVVAVMINELRTSDQPRSWSELCSLPLLDSLSSASQSAPDGLLAKSSD